jgi:hypothetical protein
VLAAGGAGAGASGGAERFNPTTGAWSVTASMPSRALHEAGRLGNGTVLLAAGLGTRGSLGTSAVFDPAAGTWSAGGDLAHARVLHTLTVLADGRALVVGGLEGINFLDAAEVYTP